MSKILIPNFLDIKKMPTVANCRHPPIYETGYSHTVLLI